jgi:ribosomal protein uS13
MARIAGIDLPKNKRGVVGLTYIHGIGPNLAQEILDRVGVDVNKKVQDWSDEEQTNIRALISDEYKVEGALRSETQMNIKRLMDIGSYRGIRHRIGLPVRGQSTKNNARIYSTDLLGGKAIEIILGDSDKLAVSGDTLQSELEISIREQVSEQVEPVQKKAMALINSLDSLLMSIQGVFNPESQDNIISIFENIRVAIFSIKNSATLVDTLLAKEKSNLEKIISDIENITANLRDNNDEISTIFRNFAILSDSLASADIPQTFREAQEVIENLKIISDKLNRGEGTMGQLITNDTLYLNLQQSTENLNKLIEDIRLNPKKYVKFSVF